jgi:Big-like domain-containing protein
VVRCRSSLLALATGLIANACESTKPLPPAVFVKPASLTLEDGQSVKLTATLRNATTRTVTWVSSNAAVASVDITGNVTAITNGTATIIVRMTADTTISATVPVTVSGPAVATVNVSPPAFTAYVGLARQINTQLRAADGRIIRGRPVTWTTPDASIADVSSSGIVRGRAPGGPIGIVASIEGHTGTAQVRVAHAAEACPVVTTLTLGQRADGRLATGDCEFSLDDSYVDVYEITLTAPMTIQVDMTSAEVDSFIGLFSGTGGFIAEDDDSGGGQNARLVRQLTAGRYRVWANTIGAGTTGTYSLVISQVQAADLLLWRERERVLELDAVGNAQHNRYSRLR